jgi:hypothetical protein
MGKSRALNRAATIARGSIVAITDDDCEVRPDWLETVDRCFRARTDVGIVAGDVLPPPGRRPLRPSACPATRTIECVYRPAESDYRAPPGFYYGGANLAVRRDVFDRIGGFDEVLGPGSEFPAAMDVDFALRAEALDVAMWTTPRSVVVHTHGRRLGIGPLLRHCRTYGRGRGALAGKLHLWQHRWAVAPRTSMLSDARGAILHPRRAVFDLLQRPYIKRARAEYLAKYDIDDRWLSVRRPDPLQRAMTAAPWR